MNLCETNEFIETQLLTRWPEFKPSNVELSDLKFYLQPVDDATALKAVRQHAIESNWKRPVLKKILDYAAEFSPKLKAAAVVKIQREWPRHYLRCVSSDSGYYRRGRDMLVDVPSGLTSEQEYKCVENFMQRTIEVYGGKWQIVVVRNSKEMIEFRKGAKIA